MAHIFYSTWIKPVCCVSKISSDCGCQSKEIGIDMEVRLLPAGARGSFFSPFRDLPLQLRRSILFPQTRKKPLAPRVPLFLILMLIKVYFMPIALGGYGWKWSESKLVIELDQVEHNSGSCTFKIRRARNTRLFWNHKPLIRCLLRTSFEQKCLFISLKTVQNIASKAIKVHILISLTCKPRWYPVTRSLKWIPVIGHLHDNTPITRQKGMRRTNHVHQFCYRYDYKVLILLNLVVFYI